MAPEPGGKDEGMPKPDIKSPQDIRLLVDSFYEKVKADPVIGYLFNEIARVDWAHHLPVMYDFWETVLLDAGKYSRNAMEPHFRLNARVRLTPEHFERWLELFSAAIGEHFSGPNAVLAQTRANSIAAIMQLKMDQVHAANEATDAPAGGMGPAGTKGDI
ncbi:MAG TPA: group III truncated hemoglobin [Chitinophagaceae bacterium]|nr:group III truncated hemoglobin [Chitinophagaceae bacterium]